ncbi:MAG: dihydrofolate reductase [Niameybacter sp.]
MMISMIVAMSENYVIGKGNKMPWYIPEDLQYFKKVTKGHTVVMGSKTFESIGHPLPDRINIVLTQNRNYLAEGCSLAHSVEEVIEKYYGEQQELFIIGGSTLYQVFMPFVTKLYITWIEGNIEGDAYFSRFPLAHKQQTGFKCIKQMPQSEQHSYKYRFTEWKRESW